MVGNNELHLNQATMREAIETYLNEHMFAKPIKVDRIAPDRSGTPGFEGFVVHLVTTEDKPGEIRVLHGDGLPADET